MNADNVAMPTPMTVAVRIPATIIGKAVADHGSEDDFIGHIGGDDFVVITAPDRYRNLCAAIVETFDKTIAEFYDSKDRKRGHITGEDRQGEKTSFPLATISIAVVTNEKRKSLNHIEFGEAAAEMKELAKAKEGSLYLADRRGEHEPDGVGAHGHGQQRVLFAGDPTDLDEHGRLLGLDAIGAGAGR